MACKKIKKESEIEWEKLLREVKTLRERDHENIIPLLSSFTAGVPNRDPDNKHEHLWLMMPYADGGSMEGWLKENRPPNLPKSGTITLKDDSFRQSHVEDAMKGLVSGLTYIHREINGMVGFHHDIKPSNIVLFSKPKPIWKICDFGAANLKDPKEGTGTAHTSNNGFGSYIYRPPEYFDDEDNNEHGRAFDVYSLGCVLLELTTIHRFGWEAEELAKFESQRSNNTEHTYTGNLKPKDDTSFHNSPGIVSSWIKHLKDAYENHEEDSTKATRLVKILDIIQEMLDSRYLRIFAWEVDMELFEIFNPNVSERMAAERLQSVVQQSVVPLDRTKKQHNPMERAILHSKPQWWINILQGRDWSYSEPSLSRSSTSMTFTDKEVPISTLDKMETPRYFRNSYFFGRHDIHEKIIGGLKARNQAVGLYGKSGIG